MLETFLRENREVIIARTLSRTATSAGLQASSEELANGIPVFLEQLGAALRGDEPSPIDLASIRRTSGQHAVGLLRRGLTVAQVVHCYGDVCQVVTELAVEREAQIISGEFQTLNLCLDDAIAEAVTEFAARRERTIAEEGTERLGILAHELRNLLNTAMLSFESIKRGRVSASGSTGMVHARSLLGLRDLIDRSLADVRLDAGIDHREPIAVVEFIEEVEISALIQARARAIDFTVLPVPGALIIDGDRQILAAALTNLLHNAFKFTHKQGRVTLTTRATADRVLFEVEDQCGGLPDGDPADLFQPFEQRGADRRGAGLGLAVCQRAAKANGGTITVRDLPGEGCVFTLELPRATVPSA